MTCTNQCIGQQGAAEQAIEQSRCENSVIVEDGGPLLVHAIRCNQGGTPLIAVAQYLEQAVGPELVDGQVAQLIDRSEERRVGKECRL